MKALLDFAAEDVSAEKNFVEPAAAWSSDSFPKDSETKYSSREQTRSSRTKKPPSATSLTTPLHHRHKVVPVGSRNPTNVSSKVSKHRGLQKIAETVDSTSPLSRKGGSNCEDFFRRCIEEEVAEATLRQYLVSEFFCTQNELDLLFEKRNQERWKVFYRNSFTTMAWGTGAPLLAEGFFENNGTEVDREGSEKKKKKTTERCENGLTLFRKLIAAANPSANSHAFQSNDAVTSGVVSSADAIWKLRGCHDDDFPSVASSVMTRPRDNRQADNRQDDVLISESERFCSTLQSLPSRVISNARELKSSLGRLPNFDLERVRSNARDIDYSIFRSK